MEGLFTPEQEAIREAVLRVCAGFDESYWRRRDDEGGFPEDFVQALAKDGWLGTAMPEEVGGAGLGITETAIVAQAISESGAANSGVSAVVPVMFGLNPVVVAGTDDQKSRMLPPVIRREDRPCFGVTEPDAGLDTSKLKTFAERKGDRYIVNGQKIWTTTAQVANKIMLIARTKPVAETKRPLDGLTLFYTDLDRNHVEIREIPKMGRKCVDSNQVFFDNMPVPVENRIGEEGEGFKLLLHGLNPERIQIAAGLVGLGRAAIRRAAQYAKERIVFDRPIGKNQAIQHRGSPHGCGRGRYRTGSARPAAAWFPRPAWCGR